MRETVLFYPADFQTRQAAQSELDTYQNLSTHIGETTVPNSLVAMLDGRIGSDGTRIDSIYLPPSPSLYI